MRQKMSVEQETNGFSPEQDCASSIKKPSIRSVRHVSGGRAKWLESRTCGRIQTTLWIKSLAILFWFVVLIGFPLLILCLRMCTR